MRKILAIAVGVVTVALASGCATPKIEPQLVKPKTVALVDFPNYAPVAIIGISTARWPQQYFFGANDQFFLPEGGQFSLSDPSGNTILTAGVAGAIAGRGAASSTNMSGTQGAVAGGLIGLAVGAVINSGAESTQKKAEGFPALFQTAMPGLDIRMEVLGALRKSLEAKGITVSVLSDSRNLAPRLRWHADDKNGKPLEAGPLADSPAVNVDIVAQVVPMMVYASPGPLNNYNSVVGFGVALYEGRTRRFLGWQAFQSDQNKLWYARYDTLAGDISQAAPAQYNSLMSLIPQVSDVISGGAQ